MENVPLVGFMYPVFTPIPGGVAVGNTGLLLCPLSTKPYYLPSLILLKKMSAIDSMSSQYFGYFGD